MAFKGIRIRYILAGASAVSATAGAGATYIFTTRRLEKAFEERLDRELDLAKTYYAKLNKDGEFADPETLASERGYIDPEQLKGVKPSYTTYSKAGTNVKVPEGIASLKVVEEAVGVTVSIDEEGDIEVTEVHRNIFDEDASGDHFNLEEEEKNRTQEYPYVISESEWENGLPGTEKIEMTYYAGDQILVDGAEEVVPDEDPIIGLVNLKRFGHGSNDPDIVYIRNERLDIDFMVVRNHGTYGETIGLGQG